MQNNYIFEAEVIRWVDADTVILRIQIPFYLQTERPCRLKGINAPERFTLEGKRATARVNELAPAGTKTTIQSYKDPNDKYGRYLVRILGVDGKPVNDTLVSEGLAVPYLV